VSVDVCNRYAIFPGSRRSSGAFHFVFKGSIQPETDRKPLDV
tara:strand:+ start:35 stop:160 length:126 start_codon:yes stop_codon:yes gene_type:complete